MKFNLALVTGAIVLAPALAGASQPAQTPTGQGATQTQSESGTQSATANPKHAVDADSSCAATSSDAKPAHPSAKVGKDTGDLPPPRKTAPKEAPKQGTCGTQPQ